MNFVTPHIFIHSSEHYNTGVRGRNNISSVVISTLPLRTTKRKWNHSTLILFIYNIGHVALSESYRIITMLLESQNASINFSVISSIGHHVTCRIPAGFSCPCVSLEPSWSLLCIFQASSVLISSPHVHGVSSRKPQLGRWDLQEKGISRSAISQVVASLYYPLYQSTTTLQG